MFYSSLTEYINENSKIYKTDIWNIGSIININSKDAIHDAQLNCNNILKDNSVLDISVNTDIYSCEFNNSNSILSMLTFIPLTTNCLCSDMDGNKDKNKVFMNGLSKEMGVINIKSALSYCLNLDKLSSNSMSNNSNNNIANNFINNILNINSNNNLADIANNYLQTNSFTADILPGCANFVSHCMIKANLLDKPINYVPTLVDYLKTKKYQQINSNSNNIPRGNIIIFQNTYDVSPPDMTHIGITEDNNTFYDFGGSPARVRNQSYNDSWWNSRIQFFMAR